MPSELESPQSANEGRRRVVIESVTPEIDGGRFAIKRTAGEKVIVEADIFADGHDELSSVLLYRRETDRDWNAAPMRPLANDRWRGEFLVGEPGRYRYTLQAWVDEFKSWHRGLEKKVAAGQDVAVDLLIGARLVESAAKRAALDDAARLESHARALRSAAAGKTPLIAADLPELMERYPDKTFAVVYPKELPLVVDDARARFGAWYELFPRSCAPAPGRHGTFDDCAARLPYIAEMGFDVLYLPPIHPIGRTHRKGKNNATVAGPQDPGSPWAIGAAEGGHKSIHPQLGTLADFRRLVAEARKFGIEIALDIAFQCTPDHPYVREHPEWFRYRPDGSVQYAENPPKKYEDIYPLNFDTPAWRELWEELRSIVLFWLEQGVRIFRVDNPHTKPFAFWEWLIASVKKKEPRAIFLSEAFTRPKVMYRLAKLGFTQSYTYFAWRNTKSELTDYFTELTQTEVREFFRPSLWPNTPDILTEYLQFGGRPAFMARLVLAATLGANYGIYGPAFELCVNRPREAGSEEYLDSEKYEIKHWELDRPESLRHLIARVNRIRRENGALQHDASLRFHPVSNDQLLCYSKHTEDLSNVILTVVNLDPYHTQSGWVDVALEPLRLDAQQPYQVHDLLTDARYIWQGSRNYVELNPQAVPAHIFRVLRRTHREQDFDYFM
ncbi:MAG TPA: alpha-1,4-glucan--maltose-1-phosphate maltosyltransferase [Candidatus Acidoferrales bacterium]|nr:alpha-1,4-glucan--maltose-1-phosphate maltosyltransferase [Candidatus Acidoferrales bacterium]